MATYDEQCQDEDFFFFLLYYFNEIKCKIVRKFTLEN